MAHFPLHATRELCASLARWCIFTTAAMVESNRNGSFLFLLLNRTESSKSLYFNFILICIVYSHSGTRTFYANLRTFFKNAYWSTFRWNNVGGAPAVESNLSAEENIRYFISLTSISSVKFLAEIPCRNVNSLIRRKGKKHAIRNLNFRSFVIRMRSAVITAHEFRSSVE